MDLFLRRLCPTIPVHGMAADSDIDRERQRETERDRKRQKETESDSKRQKETERTERDREVDAEAEAEAEAERGRERRYIPSDAPKALQYTATNHVIYICIRVRRPKNDTDHCNTGLCRAIFAWKGYPHGLRHLNLQFVKCPGGISAKQEYCFRWRVLEVLLLLYQSRQPFHEQGLLDKELVQFHVSAFCCF